MTKETNTENEKSTNHRMSPEVKKLRDSGVLRLAPGQPCFCQAKGWQSAWRGPGEVQAAALLRILPPSTGEKGQTAGIEKRPESIQDQPAQAPHPRRERESATCRPTIVLEGDKGQQGDRSQDKPPRHRPGRISRPQHPAVNLVARRATSRRGQQGTEAKTYTQTQAREYAKAQGPSGQPGSQPTNKGQQGA